MTPDDEELLTKKELTEKEILALKKQAISHLTTYAWSPSFPKARVCSKRLEMLCDMVLDKLPKQLEIFQERGNEYEQQESTPKKKIP